MTFELAISTMHKNIDECLELVKKMNVNCDCIVINQCDNDGFYEEIRDKQKIRIFSSKERGLSKSRNLALSNAKSDILGIADDDLFYYDDFDKKIIKAYELHPNASAVCFNIDAYDATYPDIEFKCRFRHLFSFMSVMITLKVQDIKKEKIFFNEFFGTGSEYFQSGEENILLGNIFSNGLCIYYNPNKILRIEESDSSWFHGFDRDFIETRGAITYAMSPKFSDLWILLFAIKKCFTFKQFNLFQIYYFMLFGRKKYKKIILGNSKIV